MRHTSECDVVGTGRAGQRAITRLALAAATAAAVLALSACDKDVDWAEVPAGVATLVKEANAAFEEAEASWAAIEKDVAEVKAAFKAAKAGWAATDKEADEVDPAEALNEAWHWVAEMEDATDYWADWAQVEADPEYWVGEIVTLQGTAVTITEALGREQAAEYAAKAEYAADRATHWLDSVHWDFREAGEVARAAAYDRWADEAAGVHSMALAWAAGRAGRTGADRADWAAAAAAEADALRTDLFRRGN